MSAQPLSHHLQTLSTDDILHVTGDITVTVSAPFVESSADVEAGGVFVARAGRSVDGHNFIPQAIERGAVAIIGERAIDGLSVPYVQVRDAMAILGLLAASYHDFPSRKLTIIGVTGTDGKTTTSHILHSILNVATGGKAGFISTIAADFGGRSADTGLHVTTPGAPQVQGYLAEMVRAGLSHVVLEMTSHGLAQGRLVGVEVDGAVLTNIQHEHLDFHGSWEAYRDAKAILFRSLMATPRRGNQKKFAVINADDTNSYAYFKAIPAEQHISYAIDSAADVRPIAIDYAPDGTHFAIDNQTYSMALVGPFNVYNALAAISAARALGVSDDAIADGLRAVTGVSGRMERIDEGQDFIAIVDFAHTPNALLRALEAARTMVPADKRVIVVFGSAGLRDVQKRRMMAETAAQLADMTVLTAEDPRTESLDAILEMMAEGCRSQGGVEGQTFIRVPDRGAALYQACQMAQTGDLVMACGKGHEQSMCFGTIEYPWDDRDALRAALRGEPLMTLPTAHET